MHTGPVSGDVAMQLMELAGGDRFAGVRTESEIHQRSHGCGPHHAGADPRRAGGHVLDEVGATTPDAARVRDHTYLQEIVTQRGDDDVWRVISANKCEQWTSG